MSSPWQKHLAGLPFEGSSVGTDNILIWAFWQDLNRRNQITNLWLMGRIRRGMMDVRQHRLRRKRGEIKNRKIFFILPAMITLLFGLLSCGGERQEAAEGEKGKFFTIYFSADLSRALGFLNAPRAVTMSDTIDFINQKFGGLADSTGEIRKFRLEWYDDQYDYSLALPNIERWAKRKNFIYFASCILPSMIRERMAELEVVQKNCGVNEPLLYPPGWIFGSEPLRAGDVVTMTKWVCDNWDYKKMGRPPRIVLSSYDVASGRYAIRDYIQNWIKDNLDCEIVDVGFTPLITVDPGTYLARWKAKKADWIIGHHIATSHGPMVKENHTGGYGFKFASTDAALEQQAINKIAGGGEACNGTWFSAGPFVFLEQVAKDKPNSITAELYRFILERRGEAVHMQQIGFAIGCADVLFIYEALKEIFAANKDITWENLHSRHIVKHINDNWSDKNLWDLGRVNYSSTRRDPKYIRMISVVNGKPVFSKEWIEVIDMLEPKFKTPPFAMPTTPPVPKKAS